MELFVSCDIHVLLVYGDKAVEQSEVLFKEQLGRYANIAFDRVILSHDVTGRPICLSLPHLFLSRSHKKNCVLNAFASQGNLGVDVELIDPSINHQEIAEAFFPQSDVIRLKSVAGTELMELFFLLWTGKESLIKTHGWSLFDGLRRPLPLIQKQETPYLYRVHHWSGILFFIQIAGYQIAIASGGIDDEYRWSFTLRLNCINGSDSRVLSYTFKKPLLPSFVFQEGC